MTSAMTQKPIFGERLRSLRLSASLTLHELAEKSGLNFQTIHKIEAGHRSSPGWDTVVALAEALGVTPDAFLEADVPDQPDDAAADGDDDPPARASGKRK